METLVVIAIVAVAAIWAGCTLAAAIRRVRAAGRGDVAGATGGCGCAAAGDCPVASNCAATGPDEAIAPCSDTDGDSAVDTGREPGRDAGAEKSTTTL